MSSKNVKATRSEDPYASFHSGAESPYGPSAPTEWGQPMEIMQTRAAQTGRTVKASAGGDSGGDVAYAEDATDEGEDYGATGGDAGGFGGQ